MDESLIKLCNDKIAHAKFKQLYRERPIDKVKGLQYDQQKVAFYLAWESCKRIMKEAMEEELKESVKELLATYSDLGLTIEVMGVQFVNAKILEELRI